MSIVCHCSLLAGGLSVCSRCRFTACTMYESLSNAVAIQLVIVVCVRIAYELPLFAQILVSASNVDVEFTTGNVAAMS